MVRRFAGGVNAQIEAKGARRGETASLVKTFCAATIAR